jgi:catechol 2,3-dioxygenase-like lactoylglutathione lyase family enzyme
METETRGVAPISRRSGLPGLRGTEHIGLTVPNLDEATEFFVNVLGREVFYPLGPFKFEDDWFAVNLDLHPRAEIPRIRLLRCGNGANFELFEFTSPDQNKSMPKFSDYGGYHIAFYVDDIDTSIAYLKEKGVKLLVEKKDGFGPEVGETFLHFKTPWGMTLELVSYPNGRAYEQEYKGRLWQPPHQVE